MASDFAGEEELGGDVDGVAGGDGASWGRPLAEDVDKGDLGAAIGAADRLGVKAAVGGVARIPARQAGHILKGAMVVFRRS